MSAGDGYEETVTPVAPECQCGHALDLHEEFRLCLVEACACDYFEPDWPRT